MRRIRAVAIVLLGATLVSSCGESVLAPRSEVLAAEDAITAWVARHPDNWTAVSSTDVVPSRPSWTPSCSDPLSNGYVSLRFVTGRGDMELAFRCPVDQHATAAVLQEHFVHAVPWNLPMGISAPNWRFQAWLPLSSVFNGVTFRTLEPGTLTVDIESTMRGIRAESTRRGCVSAADAGGVTAANAAPSCMLAREHRVPLRMRFTVRADLSALR